MEDSLERFARWYAATRRRATGREPSPVTIRNKTVLITAAERRANEVFGVTLAQVVQDRDLWLKYLDMRCADISPGAVRNEMFALRSYGEFLGDCVIEQMDLPAKNPAPAIVIYSPEEEELLCSAAWGRGQRWGCFINFLAKSGRRVGEALSLEYDWFRLDAPVPYIELPMTKNGTPQYVPLGEYLSTEVFTAQRLANLRVGISDSGRDFSRDPHRYVFPWQYGTVHDRFGRFCRNLGVENRGFHNFRHTVITNRLAAGVPLQAVSKLAGHANSAITEGRYNHTTALTFAEYV